MKLIVFVFVFFMTIKIVYLKAACVNHYSILQHFPQKAFKLVSFLLHNTVKASTSIDHNIVDVFCSQ